MSDSLKIWGTEYTDAKGFKAKDPTGQTTFTYLRPQGTKTITQNGTSIDVAEYATVNVNVSGSGGNDFIITVSKNAQTGYWEPDCTWAEYRAAYNAGKNIAMKANYTNLAVVDVINAFNYQLSYDVAEYLNSDGSGDPDYWVIESVYNFEQGGLTQREGPYTYYDTSFADSSASDLASGKIAYGQNGRIVGTYVPPAGTAGTPIATKGTVSNHSISITPSVTNITGYITGSTKTGTAVTVTVAELESGTKSISANGTGIDVSGYSTVDVAVPTSASVTYYTGSSTPSSSFGSDGDIYLQTS